MSLPTRRAALGSALALAACGRSSATGSEGAPADLFPSAAGRAGGGFRPPPPGSPPFAPGAVPRLRDLAPFVLGDEVLADGLADPVYVDLARRHFGQLTIGYDAQMEHLVQPDGSLRFDEADRVAAFVLGNGQRLMGASLVWHEASPAYFRRLADDPAAFRAAYDGYIRAVAGRYRGRIRGWDVVNEPLDARGSALMDCLWSRMLGPEQYMVRAFQVAAEADPGGMRFLNETGQENHPVKLAALMRLAERLLKTGAPITGLGAQLHTSVDTAPGDITRTLRTMAGLGLPIHVSEFDASQLSERGFDRRSRAERRAIQARVYAEALEAFDALPSSQRFAFTIFGLRDKDSWLRAEPEPGAADDEPLLFDDAGAPKPLFWTVAETLRRMPRA